MRGKAGRGDPPVKYGTGRGKRGRGNDLTCPITPHKCGIAVSGRRPCPSTHHTYRVCAAKLSRRSGAASDPRVGLKWLVPVLSTQRKRTRREKGLVPNSKIPRPQRILNSNWRQRIFRASSGSCEERNSYKNIDGKAGKVLPGFLLTGTKTQLVRSEMCESMV